MIIPPGWGGTAFSEAEDGNLRSQPARDSFSAALGISNRWAEVNQVHGSDVVEARAPGTVGSADAIWTTTQSLPLAIFTADCFGIVLISDSAVGVAHAGWRGAQAGVVAQLAETMTERGHRPDRAAIGPGIGPCCFEVGSEVAEQFPDERSSTTWGTTSVDLAAVVRKQLPAGIESWAAERCSMHEPGWFSHRATATLDRMVALAWI